MRGTRAPRSALAVGFIALGLLVSGCGSSSDPGSWLEAEEETDDEGTFPIERNFNEACREANTGEGGFDATAARSYCRCAFTALRENLEFDEFDALDNGLRTNSNPDALEGVAAAAWQTAEPLLETCAEDATA
jgi:hypothetical protein